MEFTVTGDQSSVSREVDPWEVGDLSYLWLKIQNETVGDAGAFRFITSAGDSVTVQFNLTPNDTEFSDVLMKLDTMDIWSADTIFSKFKLLPVTSNAPGVVKVDFIRFLESLIQVRSEGNALEIVGIGNSLQLYAEEVPGLSAANVTWSVDHPEIADVDANGLLTAHSLGLLTATATASDGSEESGSIIIEILHEGQQNSWEFINSVERWDRSPHACTVAHEEEALKVTVIEGDPYVSNIVSSWTVGNLKYLWLRVKNETSGEGGSMYLFPSAGGHDFVPFPLVPDDTIYRDVYVDMRDAEKWKKDLVIGSLRLDANNGGEPGDIYFDFIRFKEELVAVTSEGDATEIVGLGNTLQLYATQLIDTEDPVVFEWSVDSSGVATVNASGLVTAVKEGMVVVKASDKDSTIIGGEIQLTVSIDHTSIDQAKSRQLSIYPNPASELLNIENASDIQRVSIINYNGQVVMDISNTQSHMVLHTESLPSGIYLLRATTLDGRIRSASFVKN